MSTLRKEQIDDTLELAAELNPGALFPTGFEDAVIGYTSCCGPEPVRVILDEDLIIDILMDRDNMTAEEAQEYYEFNIAGAYMGEGTPIYANIRVDYNE